ncbi:MAG TPA: response regulator [Nitrospirae bacterium]|nr:response regulator [Nitrospirota bacterium]
MINLSKNRDITILVVEDSITQAECLKYLLEDNNYRVLLASNGKEGLDIVSKEKTTIIITDILMPEMNGYELCKAIKGNENTRDIPVILLTNLSDPEDVIRGLECGADNFITKPYDNKFLISRINYLLLNLDMRKISSSEMAIEIFFGGKKQVITSSRIQILDLLLSTFEAAIQKNKELLDANRELRRANEKIRRLEGLIPICARCKKIKDDNGYWKQIEEYLKENSGVEFTHGFCPDCLKSLYPDFLDKIKE